MLERDGEYSLTAQCELLSLNRSSLYYRKKACSEKKLAVLNTIDTIYTEHPCFGARRMAIELGKQGLSVSRPTAASYMKLMGLEAVYPKPNLSKHNPQHKKYPYLLRGVKASYPNHIWGTDITYIRMKGGFMYLAAYLDWYSRYVVSWELSDTLEEDFVVYALTEALQTAVPHIANSDQGSQFTGEAYTSTLLAHKIKISMDGRGRAMDNIFTERLWRTVKYENIYIKEYATPRELRGGLTEYFNWYNTKRPHQSLGYKTPEEVYFEQLASEKAVETMENLIH
jgi:putative transposase